jgi:hypothetical protein
LRRRRVTLGAVAWLWAAWAMPAGAVCLFSAPQAPAPQQPPPQPPPPEPPKERVEAKVVQPAPPKEAAPEAGELFFEWKYAVNGTDIKGNEDRSFLYEGVNHILDFSTFSKQPLNAGRMLESSGIFRFTDDPRVDPERNSVQKAYTKLTGPTFTFTAGDSLVNYSRFSFNQNIKGLNLQKEIENFDGLRLTATAGVFTDRWGSLTRRWEKFTAYNTVPDPNIPAKPYTREVLGFRLDKTFGENHWVGVNYSHGSDIIRSLPRETNAPPYNNHLASVDWLWTFARNLRFAGELAESASEFDARFQPDLSSDYAARLELSQQWRRYRWRLEYTRFMPNFFSVNARQVQDLQDASAQGTLDLTKQLSITATFRRTNDNLPGHAALAVVPRDHCFSTERPLCLRALSGSNRTLPVRDASSNLVGLSLFDHVVDSEGREMTTVVRAPDIHVNVKSLPFWSRLLVEAGYRERAVETSNKDSYRFTTQTSAVASPAQVVVASPLFRERVTKIPYFDVSFPLGLHQLKFTYEYRRNRDRVLPENSTFTHRVVALYRLPSLFLREWTLSTDLRFETERESKQVEVEKLMDPVATDLPLVDPLTLRPLVRRQSAGDQTRTLQGNATLQFPKYFTLDLMYRELSAALLSSFVPAAPSPLAGVRQFANGGYRRPRFRAQLQYRIRNDENRFLLFTYERGVDTFFLVDPSQPDLRSFRERVAQVTFVYRFRR